MKFSPDAPPARCLSDSLWRSERNLEYASALPSKSSRRSTFCSNESSLTNFSVFTSCSRHSSPASWSCRASSRASCSASANSAPSKRAAGSSRSVSSESEDAEDGAEVLFAVRCRFDGVGATEEEEEEEDAAARLGDARLFRDDDMPHGKTTH